MAQRPDSLHDPSWWQPYLPELRALFAELTMDVLLAGGGAGASATRAGSVLVDWDVFNEDALRWLDIYLGSGAIPGLTQEGAYAWAWSLNESTRRGVVKAIDGWVRAGAPLPELEKRLQSFFDSERARRIAVTEVTRIYASGNVMAWKASGVVSGKQWRTAVDEKVCPICSRLNNKLVELDRGWEFSAAMLDADPALKAALRAPMTVVVPPAHVMCILPGNEVVIPGRLSVAAKSLYDGRAVEITVRSGRILTVTENHPILTPNGYIAAKFLREGGYVIRTLDAKRIATAVNPDNDHVPTAIEEVFRSLKESSLVVTGCVPPAAEDFHGDGRAIYGDIDVVYINRLLESNGHSALGKQIGKQTLGGHDISHALFSGLGLSNLDVMREGAAARGGMRRRNLGHALLRRHERPLEQFGGSSSAYFDSGFHQSPTDGETRNAQTVSDSFFGFAGKVAGNNSSGIEFQPETLTDFVDSLLLQDSADDFARHSSLAREFVNRFAGLVAPDEIINIRHFDFCGHVYDLQNDDYELYITNDVVTSNCRCWLAPVVFEALTEDEIAAMRWEQ